MKKLVIESLNEGFASDEGNKMERIFNAIGYDDFHDFIQDNPGAIEALTIWIEQYFGKQLKEKFDKEELENMGFYGIADLLRYDEDENVDDDTEQNY